MHPQIFGISLFYNALPPYVPYLLSYFCRPTIADCSKACQKDGWKNCDHKETCKVYLSNRELNPNKPYDVAEPIPICLASCGWLDDDTLAEAMDLRTSAFLEEYGRWARTGDSDFESPPLYLQVSMMYNLGHARLQAGVSFWDEGRDGVSFVNGLLFHAVDQGAKARRDLHPSNGGSGTLSKEAKAKVLKKITWFFEMARQHNVEICSLSYGRGLMWMVDDNFQKSSLVQKWKELGGKRLLMTGDSRHVMADACNAGMEAGLEAMFGEMMK